MSKIRNAKGRDPKTGASGYERLFGVPSLGQLLSKCQATVISTGNELERILESKIANTQGVSIGKINKEKRIFKKIKRDANGKTHDVGIDVVIERNGKVKMVELKDGDVFDVKKVAGEVESLNLAKDFLVKTGKYKEGDINIYFCSFNQENKDRICMGAKGLLPEGTAMTGRELCEELGIDYDRVVKERKQEQPDNLEFFLRELITIPEVRQELARILRKE